MNKNDDDILKIIEKNLKNKCEYIIIKNKEEYILLIKRYIDTLHFIIKFNEVIGWNIYIEFKDKNKIEIDEYIEKIYFKLEEEILNYNVLNN